MSGPEVTAPAGVGLESYLRWVADDPDARRAFLEPEALRLGGRTGEVFLQRARLLAAKPVADVAPQVQEFTIRDGAGGMASIVVLTQRVEPPPEALRFDADLFIEVFRSDGAGLELLALERKEGVPRTGRSPHVDLVPIAGRWMFLTVFAHHGGMGTGMSGARTDWLQVSTEGASWVWSQDHSSTDANTTIAVAAGVLGVETAELNGRPAVFADAWKGSKSSGMDPDLEVEKEYHRAVAVWRSPADHARFIIEERYSGLTADQAAGAWSTPREEGVPIFADKRPEAVAEAARWLGLKSAD